MVRRGSLTIGLLLMGCQQPDDLREWKPSDHHHNTIQAAEPGRVPEAPASAEAPRPGLDEVTLVTWRRNCTTCHGQLGRGDGPQAPMTKPRDLTDPTWQASVTDDAIAQVIRTGRGRMPAFPLPEATLRSLVQLIRLLGGQGNAQAAGAPSVSAGTPGPAPSTSGGTSPPPRSSKPGQP